MGRLPLKFAGKDITFREPFEFSADLSVVAGDSVQYVDKQFLESSSKPFEIHRVIPRLTAYYTVDDVLTILEPQPTILSRLIRLRMQDLSKNEPNTKTTTLIDTLTKANEETWEFEEPYTIVRGEQFQVSIDAASSFGFTPFSTLISALDPVPTIDSIRVELTFQGFHIVIGPPLETR